MVPDTGTPRRSDAVGTSGCGPACPTCARLRLALRAVLVDQTWNDLTVAAIAGVTGMTETAYFAHYPSVAACGAAALDEAAEDCRDACESAYPAWRNCSERFVHMADAVVQWIVGSPEMARLLFVIPGHAGDPVLLRKLGAFKRAIVMLFDQPGRCSPAGRTHVEFVIGLFFQVAARELVNGAELVTLRHRVLALAPFVETPPPTPRS